MFLHVRCCLKPRRPGVTGLLRDCYHMILNDIFLSMLPIGVEESFNAPDKIGISRIGI
jgi:hypothetical protein